MEASRLTDPNRDAGTTFFISTSSGMVEPVLDSSYSNTVHTKTSKSLTAELDELCGPPFICNLESRTGEAAVVYTNFESNEDNGAEDQVWERNNMSFTHRFRSLTLLESMQTLDGSGVKLRFEQPGEIVSIPTTHPEDNYHLGSPVVAVTRTRRSKLGKRRKALREKKTDSELFAERLRFHQARFYNLCDQDGENPFIRCAHWYNDGRTFAFASVFFETRSSRKAIVAVLWHTKIRPHRAVCVSLSLETSGNTENGNERGGSDLLVAHCSCSPLLSQDLDNSDGCYHTKVCLADEAFRAMVASEIRRREYIQDLQDRGDTIFGQCIPLDDASLSPINLSILLDRNASKNSTLASPWLFFMMFDLQSLLFLPVSKVKGKPFRCFLCRLPLSRRGVCGHEDTAKKVSQFFRQRRGFRAGMLLELALPIDKGSNGGADPGPEEAEEDNAGQDTQRLNRSVSVPEIYTPIDVRRPILPCRGEWEDMISVSKALDTVREGEMVVFDDRVEGNCHECGSPNNGENYDGYSRYVYLFTLNQGTRKVKLYDWWCSVCEKTRRFSGRGTGVFPVTHNSAFTTELMYLWLEMTCSQGYSFRNAYRTTRAFQRTASKVLQPKGRRLDFDEEFHKTHAANRRRANDALREFIKLLDTNGQVMTRTLFSCNTCEVPLTRTDCKELGISEEDGSRLKRFKALVIDGTASGILTELPPMEREHVTVPEPMRLKKRLNESKKLLKFNPHRLALKQIMNLGKESFRKWKVQASDSSVNNLSTSRYERLRFWISKTGTNSCSDIIEPQKYPSELEQNITKLFLQETPCFCSQNMLNASKRRDGSSTSHAAECIRIRTVLQKRKEDESIFRLLRSLFSIEEGNPGRMVNNRHEDGRQVEAQQSNSQQGSDRAQDNANGVNQESAENGSRGNANVPDGANNDAETNNENEADNARADDGSDSDSEIRELYKEIQIRRQVSGIWLSLIPLFQRNSSQMFECTLLLIEFLLLEHVAMPYVGRFEAEQTGEVEGQESMTSMTSFAGKSIKAHVEVINALQTFSNACTNECNIASSSQSVRVGCLCFLRLKRAALSIRVANPILSAFCQELLKLRKPLDGAYQNLINSLVAVLWLHLNTAKTYFATFERSCSQECKEYWLSWGRPATIQSEHIQQDISQNEAETRENDAKDGEDNEADHSAKILAKKEMEDSLVSGICFPGRERCRPSIIFKLKDEKACNKNYTKPRSHSPGLMTVQCACDAPKLIGFIVMTQAESTALALSSFLSHFPIPPKTVYYDNACNLFQSVMLRVPWVLKNTRLEVDRFHYKSHKCSSYFDPDVYQEFDTHYTETAESINARIKKTLQQLRYLKGNHVVPFLRTRFSFINLAAAFKARYDTDDIEEEDMTLFFQQIFNCSCNSCKLLEDASLKEESDTKSSES